MGEISMRERIARALAAAEGKDPDAPAWVRFPGAIPEGICWRDQYCKQADAVLAAMREPTEAMIDASNREWDGRMSHRSSGAWQAMIDAAGD